MILLEAACAALSVAGLVQAVLGAVLVRRFAAKPAKIAAVLPPITLLKPLHGGEPLLERALESFCVQDYPAFQIVFGVQDAADPALDVVRRLQARFPSRDIAVVIDPTPHGSNRKVANLINMLPAARHDVLVIADSDVHAAPDCLRRLAASLERQGVGVVTALYAGRPVAGALPAMLGAMHISHNFMPGALLARALGRQDCLGAVMALHRRTLARIGGLAALANELADDAVLGRLALAHGLRVELATTIPVTTVAERDFRALWRHELRWARTIRSLAPIGFAASIVQYPLVWALAALLASHGAVWSIGLFGAVWATRAIAARSIDRALALTVRPPIWLLPLRDALSMAVLLASYRSERVEWRGQMLLATPPRLVPAGFVTPSLAAPAGALTGQPIP